MCYDRRAIAAYADYIALMAYDQNGASSSRAGSVGDLPWVENALKKTLEEVPAEKIILGVPFYTRVWQSKNGAVVKTSAVGMTTAMNQINEAGAEIVYDDATGQNYATWQSGGVTFEVWLEDATSMRARIALVEKYGLAGIASWSKGFENNAIWDVIASALTNGE
jgi:spore germination protein YaaH